MTHATTDATQSVGVRERVVTVVASLLAAIVLIGGLYAGAACIHLDNWWIVVPFVIAVVVGQAFLLRGRRPMIASLGVGLVWMSFWITGVILLAGEFSWQTPLALMLGIPLNACLGAILAFVVALAIVGVRTLAFAATRTPFPERSPRQRMQRRDYAFLASLALAATVSACLTWPPTVAASVSSRQASEHLGELPRGASDVSYLVDYMSGWIVFDCRVDEPGFADWSKRGGWPQEEVGDVPMSIARYDGSIATIRDGCFGVIEHGDTRVVGVAYDRTAQRAYYYGPKR